MKRHDFTTRKYLQMAKSLLKLSMLRTVVTDVNIRTVSVVIDEDCHSSIRKLAYDSVYGLSDRSAAAFCSVAKSVLRKHNSFK